MTAPTPPKPPTLADIAAQLAEIKAMLTPVAAFVSAMTGALGGRGAGATPVGPASARELDSKSGDPLVRFNPRGWDGEPTKGRKMSNCRPDALDILAEAHDFFAQRKSESEDPEERKKASYEQRSARLARGWAKRLREGWKPAGVATPPPIDGGDFSDSWDGSGVEPQAPAPADDWGAPSPDDDIPF